MELLFGIIVGFSLGLTGGGGSIFAVPLLVYGLAVPVHQAVGVSLAVVGATALGGAVARLRQGEVEVRTAVLFGLAGVAGAPLGAWLGAKLSEPVLLVGFALLMLLVATRMWWQAARHPVESRVVRGVSEKPEAFEKAVCRFNPAGELTMTSRCALVLVLSGSVTGVLAGLFGVGGGFLIVPALVLTASLSMHRAVATSLLVIAIISAAGTVSHILAGKPLDPTLVVLFVIGGLGGMVLGSALSRRLAGPLLQKLFAMTMIGVAIYIIVHSLLIA